MPPLPEGTGRPSGWLAGMQAIGQLACCLGLAGLLPGWLLGWHNTLLVLQLRQSLCPCLPGCSWGSTWGNTGFIDIAMDFEGQGMCGMYKHAFYPNTPVGLDGPQPPLPPLPDPMFSANFRPYPASMVRWSSWSGWTWSPSGAVTADLL